MMMVLGSSRSAMIVSVTAVLLMAGGLSAPASLPGWAAGLTTFVWGRSGDAETLDMRP